MSVPDALLGARRIEAPADMEALGRALGEALGPGDVVVLTGPLGAGKTTLTRGIGAGLGVRGPVQSPTFVVARTHPSLVGGAPLVHVDAYRLGSAAELDDLDLDLGPSGRRADSNLLVHTIAGWAMDAAPFVDEAPLAPPTVDVDPDESIDFAPSHSTKALERELNLENEKLAQEAKARRSAN